MDGPLHQSFHRRDERNVNRVERGRRLRDSALCSISAHNRVVSIEPQRICRGRRQLQRSHNEQRHHGLCSTHIYDVLLVAGWVANDIWSEFHDGPCFLDGGHFNEEDRTGGNEPRNLWRECCGNGFVELHRRRGQCYGAASRASAVGGRYCALLAC